MTRGGWLYVDESAARDALAEMVEERWKGWVATGARPYDVVDAFTGILAAGHWKIAPMATDDEIPTGATAEWTATTASGAVTVGGVDILFAGSTLAYVLNAIDEEWPAARFWWHANADGTLIATITDRVSIHVVTYG